MKRSLAALSTVALSLAISAGLSSNASGQAASAGAGSLILTDPLGHTVTLSPPINPSPAYSAWQEAGFPPLTWGAPVPPASGVQAGFIYGGPTTGAVVPHIAYWLPPGQSSISGSGNTGGYAGAWDYATAAQLGLTPISSVAGTTGMLAYFTGANSVGSTNLSGDVTTSGGTSTTIATGAVTYAKMQSTSGSSILLGRDNTGAGTVQEITLGSNLSMSGTTLSASAAPASTASLLAGETNGANDNNIDYYYPVGLTNGNNHTIGFKASSMFVTRNGTIKNLYVGLTVAPGAVGSNKGQVFTVYDVTTATEMSTGVTIMETATIGNSGAGTLSVNAGDIIVIKRSNANANNPAGAEAVWSFDFQ